MSQQSSGLWPQQVLISSVWPNKCVEPKWDSGRGRRDFIDCSSAAWIFIVLFFFLEVSELFTLVLINGRLRLFVWDYAWKSGWVIISWQMVYSRRPHQVHTIVKVVIRTPCSIIDVWDGKKKDVRERFWSSQVLTLQTLLSNLLPWLSLSLNLLQV